MQRAAVISAMMLNKWWAGKLQAHAQRLHLLPPPKPQEEVPIGQYL